MGKSNKSTSSTLSNNTKSKRMATKSSKGVMLKNRKRSVKTKSSSVSKREVSTSRRNAVGMKSYAVSGAGAKKRSSKIRKRVSKRSSRKNKTSGNLSKDTKSDIKSLTILVRARDAKGRFATSDFIGEEMSLTIDLPIRKPFNGTTETSIKNEKH